MSITFETDNDVIIYALDQVISDARNTQYICLPQSVRWICSIIGLQQGVFIHIDNVKRRSDIGNPDVRLESPKHSSFADVHPSRAEGIPNSDCDYSPSEHEAISTTEPYIHNEVINNCEIFLKQSKQKRKAIGRITRQASRKVKQKLKKKKPIKTFRTQTEGIDGNKLRRRKAAGDCQSSAWPQDRKGSHKTLDCFRWKRIENGTAPVPKMKRYNQD
jgi:hypothetical protein